MQQSVAIVIPIWKNDLTAFEKISFLQCCSVLNKYQIVIVSYRELDLTKYTDILKDNAIDYKVFFFRRKFFCSTDSYNKLLLSFWFYIKFIRFKYILIHQLDCFVFRDELELWVKKGYSYIGAPWLKGYDQAMPDAPVIGVGNGGLSLRNVNDHLKVLLSFSYITKPQQLTQNLYSSCYSHLSNLKAFLILLRKLTVCNNFFFLFNNWSGNEDIFWGQITPKKISCFTVAHWEVAAQFSIEVQPEKFFEIQGHRLPFGCHAWWRYDLNFWKPFIESFGYNLNP